ncbi:BQ5605_C012g06800 [Microbotryum silenes-dioicae]|uniref:BQ5605_C012g06800 protein n=1 Tax=Microbotryum silenes-dioicae TaxID=796604 RepID=A0A2X0NV29_9BASI|nr:BQ5605_C012g06800 [Microbotryum silenes-dioicae]
MASGEVRPSTSSNTPAPSPPPPYRPPSSQTLPILRSLIQSTSFRICSLTRTLYLPIPHPSLTLSLTLPNPLDFAPLHRTLNDPLVALQLEGPPYPYTEDQARDWIKINTERYERIVARWIDAGRIGWDEEGCPVGNLRLGEGAGVGGDADVKKEEGDVEQDTVWSYGCAFLSERRLEVGKGFSLQLWVLFLLRTVFLAPQYHRQGIMAAALQCIIESYLIPVLKARHIRSCAFEDNWGSRRTQEKCGMRRVPDEDHEVDVAESRGGSKKVHVQFEYIPR